MPQAYHSAWRSNTTNKTLGLQQSLVLPKITRPIGLPANFNLPIVLRPKYYLPLARIVPYFGYVLTAYELYNFWNNIEPWNLSFNGPWTKQCACPSPGTPEGLFGPDVAHQFISCPPADVCQSGQAITGQAIWNSDFTVPDHQLTLGRWRNTSPLFRKSHIESWTRPGGVGVPIPKIRPRLLPRPRPYNPREQLEPRIVPPNSPMPKPYPLPRPLVPTVPDPSQPRDERTEMGPLPKPRPDVLPPRSTEPPRGGTKERKVQNKIINGGLRIINLITESVDAINALYDALPDHIKERRATPQRKATLLYRHYDEIDIPQAIFNLITENLLDYFYGQIGQLNAEASAEWFDYKRGFSAGPAI